MKKWTPRRIQRLRTRLGLTWVELAEILRVSEPACRHWGNGTRPCVGPATVILDQLESGTFPGLEKKLKKGVPSR